MARPALGLVREQVKAASWARAAWVPVAWQWEGPPV